ncbi:MAG: LPS-assembly protein LptD [Rickettsia endosymbiont of Ixodes persulcatus]|nr:LPS-assembly protein LptD [Rickettsia endosymbiont of Ixodes persulcatus]MCZ6903354.1 LPS-assembly protein LptD [Rickettsia endosymbiont of Ixodes persulcatus]MCZ6908429.1 LPS-assembly protein LptD [Rickettsia endosymbiont of Ixodes persulcatus]MCZ6909815.1 LPS-assembly protein LptD [Rickettsia endosymbiont of Ixodes persulcatus]MCZ6913717.1 LPS-assembly protein LptD [Rickettsia endosymbiont of Ixodes persulcatus]
MLLRIICLFIIIISPLISFADNFKNGQNIKIGNMIADFVEYNESQDLIYAKGNIKIITDEYLLTADNLLYDIKNDILWAEGNIRIKDKQNRIIEGNKAVLKDEFKKGIILEFILLSGDNNLLIAKLAERIDENNLKLRHAEFTPCVVTCNRNPIWQIASKDTYIHSEEHRVVYKNVFFEVYGVPVFFLPYFFHPTPTAPATSGLLVPDVKNKGFGIPLYLRAKSNIDFTLTPRIFSKYQTFELEARYRPNDTDNMNFQGSYGKLPYFLEKDGSIVKNKKVFSYHYIASGNFISTDKVYDYGFRIERTSDKAYLKNYYNNYASYLTSKIFLNKIHEADYFFAEGLSFQGLGSNDSKYTDPLVLPKINTKNVMNLNDSDNSFIVVENNTLIYKERIGKQLARTSLQFSILHNFITSSGQIFDFAAKDRGDFYLARRVYLDKTRDTKSFQRNIPELQTLWCYPLVGNITRTINLLIEPVVSFTMGRKLSKKDKKFVIIDPAKYELSEKNIFLSKRYSAIDCHDFGNRLSYGLNTSIAKEENYLKLFLGQSRNTRYSIDLPADDTENVGQILGNISNNLELFYGFRKDKYFRPIRDEVGGNFNCNKINFLGSFIQLTNLKKYYSVESIKVSNNRVRQFYGDINYQLAEHWIVGFGARIDLSKRSPNLLTRTIRVTYAKDCVRITAKIYSDYLADGSRGIKKTTSSPTISIGLKVLNM